MNGRGIHKRIALCCLFFQYCDSNKSYYYSILDNKKKWCFVLSINEKSVLLGIF